MTSNHSNVSSKSIVRQISHELRTPIAGIQASIHILETMYEKSSKSNRLDHERTLKQLHKINMFSDYMNYVLDMKLINLSQYSDTSNIEEVEMDNFIKSCVLTFPNFIKSKVNIHISNVAPVLIKINRESLQYVIWNLIDNAIYAIKSSPHKGDITISGKQINYTYTLIIQDNGCGISSNIQKKYLIKDSPQKAKLLGLVFHTAPPYWIK